jgi:RNAse (barnase) inhibitor barstar
MITYEIDGQNFSTIDGFYDEISRVLIPGATWGRNLDAFNDILWGGFGTPEDGFVLVWKNHDVSRQRLGSAFDTIVEILRGHEATNHLTLTLS